MRSTQKLNGPLGRRRHGMVLLIVSIMLLLISLAIVSLIALTQSDFRATNLRGDEMKLENLMASAEAYAQAIALMPRQQRSEANSQANLSKMFQHQSLREEMPDDDSGRFSILSTVVTSRQKSLPPFGLTNESSKLNLNLVMTLEHNSPGRGEQALLQIPGMTPQIAATILDWLDEDSIARPMGGEIDAYLSNRRSTSPRNGVPAQLDELTQVMGVMRTDLFGEENLPASSNEGQPVRPRFGIRQDQGNVHPPWSQYLTVHSRERNESFSGEPRIFLNDPDLMVLHRRLTERLGKQWANFVVFYRQFGPSRRSSGRVNQALPVDLKKPAKFFIESELDLVGARVAVPVGTSGSQMVNSPLSLNRAEWNGALGNVLDALTVDPQSSIEGRVNIDEAPREVLLALPELDPATVDQILAARTQSMGRNSAHVHATWILEQGIVDMVKMKRLLPLITTGGEVFQARLVAYFPNRQTFLHSEIVIDGTDSKRSQLYCRDLRDSEFPFSMDQLIPVRFQTSSTKSHVTSEQ